MPTVAEPLTLGEYIRRLRRVKNWSLLQVSEATGISYSHLSRIENDSTVPNVDTVVRLATELDGDLGRMLSMAQCVPQVIIDRMLATADDRESTKLLRAANADPSGTGLPEPLDDLKELCAELFGLSMHEAAELAVGIEALANIAPDKRTLIISMARSLRSEGSGEKL